MHKISNHPVHIIGPEGNSPSAFIPFCQFGKNHSSMGVKNSLFDIPVCNCFKEKYLMDQLCYEIDVNKFRDKTFSSKDLKLGFSFLVDINDVRQSKYGETTMVKSGHDLSKSI